MVKYCLTFSSDPFNVMTVNVWTAQVMKPEVTLVPKLALLPPTTKVFTENVRRTHLH